MCVNIVHALIFFIVWEMTTAVALGTTWLVLKIKEDMKDEEA